MKLTLPDDVLEPYHAMAESQGRPIEVVIAAQLERFATHTPGAGKVLVFSGPLLDRLEAAVGNTPARSEKDLCSRAENLAALSFGHIRLNFTNGQLTELNHRAERQGKSVRQLSEEIIRSMEGQFFYHSGGGEAAKLPAHPQTGLVRPRPAKMSVPSGPPASAHSEEVP